MYQVVVENTCSCFIKSKKPYEQTFKDVFNAQIEADEIVEYMQKHFCKRHNFRIDKSIDGKTYKVVIY